MSAWDPWWVHGDYTETAHGSVELDDDAAKLEALGEDAGLTFEDLDLMDDDEGFHMLRAQDEIGCVPPPTKEQWAKAWRAAEELFEP